MSNDTSVWTCASCGHTYQIENSDAKTATSYCGRECEKDAEPDERPFSESTPEHSANFTRILNQLLTDGEHAEVFQESIEGYAAAAAAASLLADWEQTYDGTAYFTKGVKRADVDNVVEILQRWAATLKDTPADATRAVTWTGHKEPQ